MLDVRRHFHELQSDLPPSQSELSSSSSFHPRSSQVPRTPSQASNQGPSIPSGSTFPGCAHWLKTPVSWDWSTQIVLCLGLPSGFLLSVACRGLQLLGPTCPFSSITQPPSVTVMLFYIGLHDSIYCSTWFYFHRKDAVARVGFSHPRLPNLRDGKPGWDSPTAGVSAAQSYLV